MRGRSIRTAHIQVSITFAGSHEVPRDESKRHYSSQDADTIQDPPKHEETSCAQRSRKGEYAREQRRRQELDLAVGLRRTAGGGTGVVGDHGMDEDATEEEDKDDDDDAALDDSEHTDDEEDEIAGSERARHSGRHSVVAVSTAVASASAREPDSASSRNSRDSGRRRSGSPYLLGAGRTSAGEIRSGGTPVVVIIDDNRDRGWGEGGQRRRSPE